MRYFIVCFFLSLFIFSCDNSTKIKLTKLEGSPAYENAKLEIDTIAFKEQEYSFKFDVFPFKPVTSHITLYKGTKAKENKNIEKQIKISFFAVLIFNFFSLMFKLPARHYKVKAQINCKCYYN